MSQINNRWPIIAILMALLVAAGCSNSSNASSGIDPDTGKHTDNWVAVHGGEFMKTFFSDPALCKECHGSDPVLQGGTSDVSCFNTKCHSSSGGAPIAHCDTDSWSRPAAHGARAKMAPGDESGFSVCQVCHGTPNVPFFGGGVFGPTCFLGCHGPEPSPHPNAWLHNDAHTHSTTDPGNAPVCASCHFRRNKLSADAAANLPPFIPAPDGTVPGCFNSTLCHGAVGVHPDNWPTPTVHGPVAKAAPGSTSGLLYCEACHGTNFDGGSSGIACQSCHGVAAPHPSAWLPGNTYSHTTTDQGNAPVCAQCHRNTNPGTPGCFNSTLCHGAVGIHPDNWPTPTVHGPVAKAAPGSTSGFLYCEACHGANFGGGTSGVACQSCHGVAAPHPSAWLPGDTYVHTTTNEGNAPVCAKCHRNTNPGSPGCFNGTLCHGAVGIHPDNWPTPTVHGPVAKAAPGSTSGLLYCETCHGTNFGGGSSGVACQSCHGVAAPHPSAWLPGDTYSHTTTDEGNAPVCAQCHTLNPGTPGCFNNTLCHGSAGSPHPDNWRISTVHGPVAKAAPGSTSGFLYCEACHGTNFFGGTSGLACRSCHGVAAPHPSAWLPGNTYSHTTTNQGNAPVCAQCHRNNNPGTAGCFNNTLCHGLVGIHPANWPTPTVHGPVAKAAPGSTSGFLYCETCHGTNFGGGTSGIACQSCHGIAAPHPSAWMPGNTYSHTTTDQGNAPVCAQCHRNNNPGTAGCFNNTLCHGVPSPHPVNWPTSTVHGPVAKDAPGTTSGFLYCEVCHGTNFDGGTSGIACQSCHGIAAPHPSAWLPGNTYSHTTTNQGNAPVCAQCHRNNNPGTAGCFNNTLCHGVQ